MTNTHTHADTQTLLEALTAECGINSAMESCDCQLSNCIGQRFRVLDKDPGVHLHFQTLPVANLTQKQKKLSLIELTYF